MQARMAKWRRSGLGGTLRAFLKLVAHQIRTMLQDNLFHTIDAHPGFCAGACRYAEQFLGDDAGDGHGYCPAGAAATHSEKVAGSSAAPGKSLLRTAITAAAATAA